MKMEFSTIGLPAFARSLLALPLALLVRILRPLAWPHGRSAATHIAAILVVGAFSGSRLTAQDTVPLADELRALRQKVEELEHKLNSIEGKEQNPSSETNNAAQVQ